MSGFTIAVIGLVIMLTLIVLRVPVAVSMLVVGMGGYWALSGLDPLLNYAKTAAYWKFSNYDLSIIPMFLVMGQFSGKAGLSRALFDSASAFLGHRRGGLAMAAIAGCAGFGAICGSSLATAATMAQVALPELRRYNYHGGLATGTLAAGGTLGILIPPSIVLVIYAIQVEANITTLFQAAFIPGILAALGYMTAIYLYVLWKPEAGPVRPKATRKVMFTAFLNTWPVNLIFILVIGGIYLGVFTPTEAAAIGMVGMGLIAYLRGGLTVKDFFECVTGAAVFSAMVFMILLGAEFFNGFLALSRMPSEAATMIQNSGMQPIMVLVTMVLIYLLLGCAMDSLAMILLTVPIFWPIISVLDFGMPANDVKIWFGIITLIVVEVGLITPPVGLNVFIINSMAKDTPMKETFKGVMPFLFTDLVRVILLITFPILALGLPHLL